MILILLAGFCLGVERGKRLAPNSQVPAVVKPMREAPKSVSQPPPALPASNVINQASEVRKPDMSAASPSLDSKTQYAIQLASYLDVKVAQLESQRLQKLGFNALVVKQKRYFELRVIGYRSRAEAMSSLIVLRKTYQDGFVKRLSPAYS